VFQQFLQLTLAGVAQGCVYALVALGFRADLQGDRDGQLRAGRPDDARRLLRADRERILGWPYWATILFAIVVMALVGMLIERIVIRRCSAIRPSRW
jgi:branched-chain amino acid transport system permease protein